MSTEFSDTQKPLFTDQEALDFHQVGKPGKIEIAPTKPQGSPVQALCRY